MRDRFLEIVVFLMDCMRSNNGRFPDSDDFTSTLQTMGYSDTEISSAYYWLVNRFEEAPEQLFSDLASSQSVNRILSARERVRLTTEAHGLLVKLLTLRLISSEQFESILERINVLDAEPVTVNQLKLIASSVVFREHNEYESFDPDIVESVSSDTIN